MTMATYPVEEPTVYGTLFEEADPWDTIGQILGLSNTKGPEKHGLDEVNQSEEWMETHSAANETEEDLSIGSNTPELQYPLIQLQKNRISSGCDSLEGFPEEAENAETAVSHSPPLQVSDEDQEKRLSTPLSQDRLDILKSPNRLEYDKRGSTEGNEEYESVLELEEMDGLFMGPSLFEDES
jgi:hypothetical protein